MAMAPCGKLLAFAAAAAALSCAVAQGTTGATGASGHVSSVEVIALSAGKESAPCLGQYKEYTCRPRSNCTAGTVAEGLCNDGPDVACCIPFPERRCSAVHGHCTLQSECGKGTHLEGRCPGFGDLTCCVQDRRFQVSKVVSSLRTLYSVVTTHDGRLAFRGEAEAKDSGPTAFKLLHPRSDAVVASARKEWVFSEVFGKKLPVFHIRVEETKEQPASHWLLAETPNRRLSLHLAPSESSARKAYAEGRYPNDRSIEGTWSTDNLELRLKGESAIDVDKEARDRWTVTARDITGEGEPFVDPRIALLTSIIADKRS